MAIPLFDDDHTYFIFTESLLNTFFGGSDSKEFACNAGDLVQSLSQEDPLEKRIATHSSILACRFLWTEEPGGATVHRVAKRHD